MGSAAGGEAGQEELEQEMSELVIQDAAYKAHMAIVTLRNRIMGDFLELGRWLYEFEQNKWYQDYGHTTFNSYLADPDVDISRSIAYALKGVHEKFVLELKSPSDGLTRIGYNKLDVIRPVVTEDNAEEWLAKAETLSRSDLRLEVQEERNGIKAWDDDAEWAIVMSVISDYAWQAENQERKRKAFRWMEEGK